MGKILDKIKAAVSTAFTRKTEKAPDPKPASTSFIMKVAGAKAEKKAKKVKTRNPPLVKLAFYNKAAYRLGMRSQGPFWARRKSF